MSKQKTLTQMEFELELLQEQIKQTKEMERRMVEDLEGLDLVRCNHYPYGDCVNERHLASEITPEFLDENKYPNILI